MEKPEYDVTIYCRLCCENVERVWSLLSDDPDKTIAQFMRDAFLRHQKEKHS